MWWEPFHSTSWGVTGTCTESCCDQQKETLLSDLQGELLPLDYSHLQFHTNGFSIWLHYFWVKILVLFPQFSLKNLPQSSCSCSPQLVLLLFPLQDFFPNLNIPRHLLNRPSEILVKWEVCQEGLFSVFLFTEPVRGSKPGKSREQKSGEPRITRGDVPICQEVLKEQKHLPSTPNIILYLKRVESQCSAISVTAGEFQELKGYPGYHGNQCSAINQPGWAPVLNEHCRCSLTDSCKSPSQQSLCVRHVRLLPSKGACVGGPETVVGQYLMLQRPWMWTALWKKTELLFWQSMWKCLW